jgi:hypothetical protein
MKCLKSSSLATIIYSFLLSAILYSKKSFSPIDLSIEILSFPHISKSIGLDVVSFVIDFAQR